MAKATVNTHPIFFAASIFVSCFVAKNGVASYPTLYLIA